MCGPLGASGQVCGRCSAEFGVRRAEGCSAARQGLRLPYDGFLEPGGCSMSEGEEERAMVSSSK